MRLLVVGLLLALAVTAQAGTTVIEIQTEGSGDIDKLTGETNLNGAMVWNGTEWIVNSTWAHKFFVDTRTGLRLKSFTTTVIQGSQPGTVSTPYAYMLVVRSLYNYQKSVAGGVYSFNAVQYRVTNQGTGKAVVLRSRGTGAGTANPCFDIYIEDETVTGTQVTAFRGDPAWFTYPMSLEVAGSQTSPTAFKTGDLPGAITKQATANGDYYLDIGGGADLGPAGVGKSFEFHTAALPVANPGLGLGSAFVTDFSYKWMDSSGNLQELRFFPYAEGQFSGTPELTFGGSMAQLASGGPWKTSVTLVNTGSAQQAQARVNFFADSGAALALPLAFPASPGAPLVASTLDRTLNAGVSLLMESQGTGQEAVQVGWAQLVRSGDIGGFAIFRQAVDNNSQEAVVPLETRNADSYLLWFDNTGDFVTSMALSNTLAQAAHIEVSIRDEAGTVIGTDSVDLAAMGHTSFTLPTRFPMTARRRGTLEFHTPAGGRISLLGLRFNLSSFTTIPVLASGGWSGAGSMSQLASGGTWKTAITLVNTGAVAAQARLNFYDGNGNTLLLPLTFPSEPSADPVLTATLDRTLAPGASLLIESQGTGSEAVKVGWAELLTDGTVRGFAIFRQTVADNAQEAVVPLETGGTNSYLLWFDNTGDVVTSMALANVSSQAAPIEVSIRDEAGALVGTDSVNLAARGHTSFALPTRFTPTAGRRGTLEFRAPPTGPISLLGLRFNLSSFTTIPVLPK